VTRGRVLVVTYAFPPSRLVGAVRWGAMSKYLRRLGFDVTVITSRLAGGLSQPEVTRVIRPADLESSPLLRRLFRRPPASVGVGGIAKARPWLTTVCVPDGWLLTWAPFALRAARREVRDRGVDCIVTTSPGESTHLVGLGIRGLGPAWVADFRDGWIFEPPRGTFSPRALDAVDRRLEATVVAGADRVVAVTEELAADFRRRFGADTVHLPNGWDPEAISRENGHGGLTARSGRVRLVYTGRLGAGTGWRRPEPFFTALERFHEHEPKLAASLEVVVAGRQTARDAALLASLRCHDAVTSLGEIPREDALRLQRCADALMLCTDGSAATSKLFEYLAAGRPILHAGGEGAAARILLETGRGVTVSGDDIDGIVNRFREIALGRFGKDLEFHGIEHYSYARLAERMADVLDDAIARRRARVG
jgi:glycosyltransferase involved in cell wall biosynthesis